MGVPHRQTVCSTHEPHGTMVMLACVGRQPKQPLWLAADTSALARAVARAPDSHSHSQCPSPSSPRFPSLLVSWQLPHVCHHSLDLSHHRARARTRVLPLGIPRSGLPQHSPPTTTTTRTFRGLWPSHTPITHMMVCYRPPIACWHLRRPHGLVPAALQPSGNTTPPLARPEALAPPAHLKHIM